MADINLEIAGENGKVSARALQTGVHQTVRLLDEYAHAMAEKGSAPLQWNVRDLKSNGSFTVGFYSSPIFGRKTSRVDYSPQITSELVHGIAQIDLKAVTPPYISEVGMRRVESFVGLIERHEAQSFTLYSQGASASVTHKTGENLLKLIEIKRTAIGSVEGRLVGINVSRSLKLSIIHQVTRKAVSCVVDEKYMELAKAALGKRVIIRGTLYKNLNGDTVRIQMREGEIQVIGPGTMTDYLASISAEPIPSFAQTRDTEEYLIGSRGE
jgi:hypothetical protein